MSDEERTQQAQATEATQGAEDTDTGNDQDKTGNRVFTQEELNAIINDRLARERNKYADYDQLKTAAQKLKEIEDSQKSETEKLQEHLAELERQNKALQEARKQDAIRMAVIAEAQRAGWRDPNDAIRLLDADGIEITDQGEVKGVSDKLKAIAKEKPYLLQQSGGVGATNPGRGHETGETPEQRRARLFGGGGSVIGETGTGGLFMPGEK